MNWRAVVIVSLTRARRRDGEECHPTREGLAPQGLVPAARAAHTLTVAKKVTGETQRPLGGSARMIQLRAFRPLSRCP